MGHEFKRELWQDMGGVGRGEGNEEMMQIQCTHV